MLHRGFCLKEDTDANCLSLATSSHNQRFWKKIELIRQKELPWSDNTTIATSGSWLGKLIRVGPLQKEKGVATGATRQEIPKFPHLSTGMLDEQCLPAVNLHSCRGFGWFVVIPGYLLLCFIPSLRVTEWGVLESCRSHGTHSCSPSGVQALWSEEFLGCLAFAWLPWSPPRQCSPFLL